MLRLGHNFFSHVPAAVHAMSELREFTCTGNEVETLTYGLSGKAMDIASMERAESAAVARERSERARFTPIRGLSGWIGEAGGEDKVGGTGKGEGDDEEEGFQETGGGSGSDSRSEEGRATDEEGGLPSLARTPRWACADPRHPPRPSQRTARTPYPPSTWVAPRWWARPRLRATSPVRRSSRGRARGTYRAEARST